MERRPGWMEAEEGGGMRLEGGLDRGVGGVFAGGAGGGGGGGDEDAPLPYPPAFVSALLELGADLCVGDCLSLACLATRPGTAEDAAMVDLLLAWEAEGERKGGSKGARTGKTKGALKWEAKQELRGRKREGLQGNYRVRPADTFRLHPFSLNIEVIKKLLAAGWDINSEQYGYWPKVPGASTFLEHAC
eukprot:jgi/Mesvir1/19637/Mv09922-RA.1